MNPSAMELSARRVLYEDEDLIAVDKPSGLVVHATPDPSRDHLVAALTRMLVARGDPQPQLSLLHRLDVGTSGVVLFAKNRGVAGALGQAFAERRATKTYLALVTVEAREFGAGTIAVDDFLAPGRGAGGRTLRVRSGGQPAASRFRVLAVGGAWALIEAIPQTGRTHQLRVHLANLGFPIGGDTLYGGALDNVKRLLLHAWRLRIDHPRTQQPLEIEARPPPAFRQRIERLELALANA